MTAAARRFVTICNGLALLVAVWFVARAGSTSILGPARTDDLPYGDLLRLNRSSAVVYSVLAVAGLAAGLSGRRPVALVVGALWGVLGAVAFLVVATGSDTLGLTRPGDSAAALALALCTAVPAVAGLDERAAGPAAG